MNCGCLILGEHGDEFIDLCEIHEAGPEAVRILTNLAEQYHVCDKKCAPGCCRGPWSEDRQRIVDFLEAVNG